MLTTPLSGQFKFREPPNRQDPQALSEREGLHIWETFQRNRALGAFELSGTLQFRPPAAPTRRYTLFLSGDWRKQERRSLIRLWGPEGNEESLHLVEKTKPEGRVVYLLNENGEERPASQEQLQGNLFPGLPLSAADLLMTYLDWPSPSYIGPERHVGRPAHVFRLANPDPAGLPRSVEVWLDEDFAAILRIELFHDKDRRAHSVRVGGFREFEDGWMFSKLVWHDHSQRSSVRFDVGEFSLQPGGD